MFGLFSSAKAPAPMAIPTNSSSPPATTITAAAPLASSPSASKTNAFLHENREAQRSILWASPLCAEHARHIKEKHRRDAALHNSHRCLVAIVPSNASHSVKALTDDRIIILDYPLRPEFG